MSEYTNNYNLIKPKKSENYDIEEVTTKNMDILDTILFDKVNKIHGKDLSTNDFTDGYKKKIDSLQTLYRFKGSVENLEELKEKKENTLGDVWNCKENNKNYCWNKEEWVDIGIVIDLTYYPTEEKVIKMLNDSQANLQNTINELDKIIISSVNPSTGENIWIDNFNHIIWLKNDNDVYEEFININNLINKNDIVNNLTNTDEDKPLSAFQGKILNEKIEEAIDSVANATDTAIKEVETNLNSIIDEKTQDSGWIITDNMSSDFKPYGSNENNRPKFKKWGKVVEIRGVLSPSYTFTADIGYKIFTLPEGYRPKEGINKLCQGSGKNKWLLGIDADGTVTFSRYGVSGWVNPDSGVWLPFHETFLVD